MEITSYSFGRITVDGKTYTRDLIIHPGGIEGDWWRMEGHFLKPEDLAVLLENKPLPEVLVIGTGHDGVMRVPEETVQAVRKSGVREVHVAKTAEAVEIFNRLKGVRAAAALHLTC
ncbi:MAG: MTH938/NDUFAF3 family protein, partial [Nitrospiraceae bacterium]|nr:MTH938/NDUFAF3 family protein [Nitrospiraceae bacterium]